jgi:hypothetical protein
MSYTSIPNQPIIFNSVLPEGCEGCGSDYSQLADFNDQLFWQLEAGECGYLNVANTAAFGATIDGSDVIFPNTGNNPAFAAFVYDKFQNCLDYRVTITINSGATGTLIVQLSNGTFAEVSAVGTHVIYLKANAIPLVLNSPTQTLTFIPKPGDKFIGTVTLTSFVPVCNGALFAGIVDATTLAVVQVLDPVITTQDQYLTAAIDLSDYELEAGCYRLAIADYCTNTCGQYYIYNPYFNDWGLCIGCPPVGWTSSPVIGSDNWVVGGGEASIELGIGNATDLISITELCEETDYYIEIEVESIDDAELKFAVDGIQYGSTITAAGTYNFTITVTQSGAVSLLGIQVGLARSGEIIVRRITVRADKNWATYDQYSDLISIGDYSDPCRFFKIEGCNAENQFGLAFNGTSFLPGIRLEGRRFRAQYNSDVDLFRYASGKAVTSYADIRKNVSFYFGQLPEYVFDFLSIITYFDNLYVNGELYAPVDEDFPEIEYNDANDLGSITIQLYKKNDKVRKTVCTAADANCLPSILDLGDEPFILAQDEDRLLTEDNINLYQE